MGGCVCSAALIASMARCSAPEVCGKLNCSSSLEFKTRGIVVGHTDCRWRNCHHLRMNPCHHLRMNPLLHANCWRKHCQDNPGAARCTVWISSRNYTPQDFKRWPLHCVVAGTLNRGSSFSCLLALCREGNYMFPGLSTVYHWFSGGSC